MINRYRLLACRLLWAGLLAVAFGPAADAQDDLFLPLDRVQAVLGDAVSRGYLPDSTADEVLACRVAGVPLTRSAVLGVVVSGIYALEGSPCMPLRGVCAGTSPDSASLSLDRPFWPDSLAAIGLVTQDELQALAPVFRVLSEKADSAGTPEAFGAEVLTAVLESVRTHESFHPSLIAGDVARWTALGLMTVTAGTHFLDAARTGRLRLGSPLLPYLSVGAPFGGRLDWRSLDRPDPARLRDGVDALNRVLDVPLVLGDVRVEAHSRGADRAPSDSLFTLVASVDGVELRRQKGRMPGSAEAMLLNQALRDRASALRVGTAVAWEPADPLKGALTILVVNRAQAEALAPFGHEVRGARAELVETIQRLAERDDLSGACERLRWLSTMPLFDAAPVEWLVGPTFDDEALRRDSVRAVYDALTRTGVLPGGDPEALTSHFLETAGWSPAGAEILWTLPASVALSFSWEATTFPPGYVAEIGRFAAITRGTWSPENRSAESVGADSLSIRFEVGGRAYQTEVEVQSDWFQSEFVDLMLRSVAETVPDGRFFWADRGRETVLFLTGAQRAALSTFPLFADLAPVESGP